jgi:hypothetical protein
MIIVTLKARFTLARMIRPPFEPIP